MSNQNIAIQIYHGFQKKKNRNEGINIVTTKIERRQSHKARVLRFKLHVTVNGQSRNYENVAY